MKRVVCMMAASWLALAMGTGWANNLTITNVTVSGRDNSTAYVQFDIAWANSWRYTNINHDAVWVFFKVQQDIEGTMSDWMHVILEGTPIEMIVPADRVGMFVRRSGEGVGTTSVQNVKAVWNFTSNSIPRTGKVKIQAFGLEMVYVAENAFKVGSGGTEANRFYAGGTANDPFTITNEGAITVANSAGNLYYRNDGGGQPGDRGSPIPAAFPKGYAAFYCMKYEITQGQWADFLNTLTRGQQDARAGATTVGHYMSKGEFAPSGTIRYRNTVQVTGDPGSPSSRVYGTVTRDRACNFLLHGDGSAFADWAGLRWMTEFEYEKACRGPLNPVADEYAFGANTYNVISGLTGGSDGSGTEYYTNGNLIVSGSDPGGPARVGIFATAASQRGSAGASYWGIMDLSGNLWERMVTVGAGGRSFTGLHGNGVLTSGGAADVTAWPSASSHVADRGGAFGNSVLYARVSDRYYGASTDYGKWNQGDGWRGVRTAPSGVGR